MTGDGSKLLAEVVSRYSVILKFLDALLVFQNLCKELIDLTDVVFSLDTFVLVNGFLDFLPENILLDLLGVVFPFLKADFFDESHANQDVVAEEVQQLGGVEGFETQKEIGFAHPFVLVDVEKLEKKLVASGDVARCKFLDCLEITSEISVEFEVAEHFLEHSHHILSLTAKMFLDF